MSISEISEVVMSFRGDTSHLKAALKDLQGTEREHAEAQIKHAEAQNARMEQQIKTYQAITSQIGAFKGVVVEAFKAIEEYGHKLDLEAAAAGVSIERMARAAGGLKSNMELLEHAARLNKSAFKLTQDQIDLVERSMYALEERGNSSQEVWSAFDAALSKGTTKSLEQFGVIIDKSGLQMDESGLKMDTYGQRAEAVKRIFDGLNRALGDEMRTATHDAADAVQAQSIRLKNSWEDLKMGLASLATGFTPVLEQLANSLSLISQIAAVDVPGGGSVGGGLKYGVKGANFVANMTNPFGWYSNYKNVRGSDLSDTFGEIRGRYVTPGEAPRNPFVPEPAKGSLDILDLAAERAAFGLTRLSTMLAPDPWAAKKGSVGNGPYTGSLASLGIRTSGGFGNEGSDPWGMHRAQGLGGLAQQPGDVFGRSTESTFDLVKIANERSTEHWFEQSKNLGAMGNGPSILERMFGKKEEFDVYHELFTDLSGSIRSGYDALVDGTKSGTEAMKAFLKDAIKGLGSRMLVRSIEETAEGFAALSNPFTAVSAATHFKSAALFAGGAVTAGLVASSIGGGGSTGGGGARPTAPNPGSGSSGGSDGKGPTIIVYGDDFTDSSARMRQLKAKKMAELALGTSSTRDR